MKKRVLAVLLSALIGMQGIAPAMAKEITYEEEILIEDSGELLDEEVEAIEEPEEEELIEDYYLGESEEESSEGELVEETIEPEQVEILSEEVELVESEPTEETVVEEEPIVEIEEELESEEVEQVGAFIASGECGANLTWTLTDDGVLTISGNGGYVGLVIFKRTVVSQ